MKGIQILVFVLLSSPARSYSQKVENKFLIEGVANSIDTGTVLLMPINTEDYYPYHGTLTAPLVEGKFTFHDSISYPTAYMIGIKQDSNWKYLSSPFYVEMGVQKLFCHTNSFWEVPTIANRTMTELQTDYENTFASIRKQYNQLNDEEDSLKKAYKGDIPDSLIHSLAIAESFLDRKNHNALLLYVRQHPGSYLALWKLIYQLSAGYEPSYDSIYTVFTDTVRKTYTGRVLKRKLEMGRLICIGCQFPQFKFSPIDDLSQKVPINNKFSKYTLIDIWFCHCSPCIYQFTKLSELYGRYRDQGFQIIGVSTDPKEQVLNWKRTINEHQLPWPQYLDENGSVAKQLSINSWPSNFLIDENGVIIQKDISPKNLELFLNNNIRLH